MKYRKLGQTKEDISSVGLGCMGMSIAYGKPDNRESLATLEKAVEIGINFWDTSDAYGNNESLISRVLSLHREKVFIATKFGWRWRGGSEDGYIDNSAQYIRKSVESSLRRLNTDVIDLYYVHRLDINIPVEETIGNMAELIKEGKVRHLGMSEVSSDIIRKAHAIHPIAALQSEYSLLTRNAENDVLPTCKELGITFVAFSPTARGLLTNTPIDNKQIMGNDRRKLLPRFAVEEYYQNNQQLAKAFMELADEKMCTASQLALAWVMAQSDNIVPIPGTKKRKYLIENSMAPEVSLSPEDSKKITEILAWFPNTGPRYHEAFQKTVAS
jgi:aryl-alcohol dehydrogenase-like predicted oxidoreductase